MKKKNKKLLYELLDYYVEVNIIGCGMHSVEDICKELGCTEDDFVCRVFELWEKRHA